MSGAQAARLPDPDPAGIPAGLAHFLSSLPPDTMIKMLTHSVSTVGPFVRFARILFSGLALPARDRELAILTTAAAAECDFVFAQHVPISDAAAVSESIRQLIRDRRYTDPGLAERDRVVIQFAACVARRADMPETLIRSAREFLSEREIVELLHVCGYYWSFCRICTVLRVP